MDSKASSSHKYDLENLPKVLQDVDKEDPISESESEESSSDSSSEEDSDKASSRIRKRPIRRNISKLQPHLKGLMGEANLRYARGDIETAKKMCFEVIRQAPDASEPYLTLSQIYENTNSKKYRGYLILAGHLNPCNVGIWCRLAEASLQEDLILEAIRCYTKAIKVEPKNIEFHKKRLELVERKGDEKMMMSFRLRMAQKMSKKQYEDIETICKSVATYYFEQKNYLKAIEALNLLFKRFSSKVTQHILNMMFELLIANGSFVRCLDLLTQYCGFTFDILIKDNNDLLITSYVHPENIQVDLRMKFIICMIKLQCDGLIPELVNSILLKDDVEQVGDLYLDVVEALMSCNYFEEALKLLVPLVKSRNFYLAAVWLKYAECLNCCNMQEQSIDAYYNVIKLAPQHVEVFYPLAMLLLQHNRRDEALEVLSQDLSDNKVDVLILIEQMKLLKQINDFENYWKCADVLMLRHSVVLKYYDELILSIRKDSYREKVTKLKKLRVFRNDNEDVEAKLISSREPSVEEEFEVYKEMLQLAKDRKEYKRFQRYTFMGLFSKRFQKQFDEIFMYAFYSCILTRDYHHGYSIIREILIHNMDNMWVWNWFALTIQTVDELRHIRFLERCTYSCPQRFTVEANSNMVTGSYTASLAFFMQQIKCAPSTYNYLLVSIAMLQLYCQRKSMDKTKKKSMAETVTYLFLNYAQNRSRDAKHEAFYNLARAYHHLGVLHLAEEYYLRVLDFDNELIRKHPDILGLRQEAAFNLHCIYRSSGNMIAARNIVMKHIVIE